MFELFLSDHQSQPEFFLHRPFRMSLSSDFVESRLLRMLSAFFVFVLRLFVLATDNETRWDVGHANRKSVVFTSGRSLERKTSNLRSRSGMSNSTSSASGRIAQYMLRYGFALSGYRDPLHSMYTRFKLKRAVDTISRNHGDHFFEATILTIGATHHFDPPAPLFRIPTVHSK